MFISATPSNFTSLWMICLLEIWHIEFDTNGLFVLPIHSSSGNSAQGVTNEDSALLGFLLHN